MECFSLLFTVTWKQHIGYFKNFGIIGAEENYLILSFKVSLINGSSWFDHHGHVLEHCRLLGRSHSSPFRLRGDSDTPSQMSVSSELMGKLFNCHHVFILMAKVAKPFTVPSDLPGWEPLLQNRSTCCLHPVTISQTEVQAEQFQLFEFK
jgi:hypothetical protein